MRDLIRNESTLISGGALVTGDITAVYPPVPGGYEIIGWTQEVVGWDTYRWTDCTAFLCVEHIENIPIYNIQPIFAPYITTYIY